MTTCLRSCDMNAIGDAANPLARFMVNLHIVLNIISNLQLLYESYYNFQLNYCLI